MTSGFIFKPETHQYFLDGVELPSVTSILKAEGFINTQFYTEFGRDRGTATHLACQLLDEDDLDWETLDPVLEPYVRAYELFKKQSGFQPISIERQVYNPTLRYAGTLDRTGAFTQDAAIIDIKTGSIPNWAGLQLEAYRACLNEPRRRFALELRENATYKLKEFKDPNDKHTWASIVAVYHWKKAQGVHS